MYSNPYNYDLENRDVVQDIPFWNEAARRYEAGRVLELACGTGRLAIPLARAGFSVAGLDLDAGMLERCRVKLVTEKLGTQDNLTLHQGDMSNFELNQCFDMVFIGFNSVEHLISLQEEIGAFQCANRHLPQGGRFIIDVRLSNLGLLALASDGYPATKLGGLSEYAPGGFGAAGYASRRYFQDDQYHGSHSKNKSGSHVLKEVSDDGRHVYFPREMRLLYMYCGFEVEDVYGDYSFGEFTVSSPRMIFVGRKCRDAGA